MKLSKAALLWTPALALVVTACGYGYVPPYVPLSVVMAVPDFVTSYDSANDVLLPRVEAPGPILAVAWYGDFEHLSRADGIAAVRESLRLTRAGAPVSGEIRDDWFDVNGSPATRAESWAFSFVPDEPLEPGAWYVLSMDFTPWLDAGENVRFPETRLGPSTHEGGVVIARFRVDSSAFWVASWVASAPASHWPPLPGERYELQGELSEPNLDWGTSRVEVFYEGDLQPCRTELGDGGFIATCDAPRDGTDVEIRLTSDVIHDARGASPSVHVISFPVMMERVLVLPDFDGTD